MGWNENTRKQQVGLIAIAAIALVSLTSLFVVEPIAQDLSYHAFKDGRTLFGIPNFWNVVSNAPYLFAGLWGMRLLMLNRLTLVPELKVAYWIFCVGVAWVCFGSGYYHWSPDNHTLVWDRLPMTVAFMAFFAIILSEFIQERLGKVLLYPMLLLGAASVFYWQYTEGQGAGDLRPYAIVQFMPMLMIPVILLCFKGKFDRVSAYWWMIAAYAAAKVFEHFDGGFYDLLIVMSGHSIKHVISAVGVFVLVAGWQKRVGLRG
jgi:hypothetical protein